MHGDQRAVVGRLLHGPQYLAVVAIEDAWVGHEQLETGDALVYQRIHLLESRFVYAAHDHVEGVVHGAFTLRFGVPEIETVAEVFAGLLDGEVDDGGRTTPCGGPGADLEGVTGECAAKREFHVGVAVDTARHHVLTGGVDDPVRARLGGLCRRGAGGHHCGDGSTVNQHLGSMASRGANHGPVLDECRHVLPPLVPVITSYRPDVQPRRSMIPASTVPASSISSSVTVIGGAIRSTFPYNPPLPIRRPAARASSMIRPAATGSGSMVPG